MTIVSEQYDDYILVYDYDRESPVGVKLDPSADHDDIENAKRELAAIFELEKRTDEILS